MEKEQLTLINTLNNDWKKLESLIIKNSEFDYPLFKKTFEETFKLLAPSSCVMTVDKQYMQLIVNAYCFVNARVSGICKEHTAAVVITERMLYNTVVKQSVCIEPIAGAVIYSIEAQKEIYLDFYDVDGTINALCDFNDN